MIFYFFTCCLQTLRETNPFEGDTHRCVPLKIISMKTEEVETDVGSSIELASYMTMLIEQLKRDRKFPAAHGYLCALHSFQRFAGGKGISLPMEEVFTRERLKAYEEWLIVRQKLELNTVSGYMRSLRAVYNRRRPPGTSEHDSKMFDNVYTKVVSKTKRALDKYQTERLMKADADGLTGKLSPEQQKVFAYFLLMFMLRGMPFIDLAHLRKNNVKDGYIVYSRHKTGKQLRVKIPPQAYKLIYELRDRNPDTTYLFPILRTDIHSGWEEYRYYQDVLRRFNRTLKQAMTQLLPGVHVSSYTARHTWATVAYHLGLPIGIISQSMGHSSIRVTEIYLKPFEDRQLDKANRQLLDAVNKGKWKSRIAYNTI